MQSALQGPMRLLSQAATKQVCLPPCLIVALSARLSSHQKRTPYKNPFCCKRKEESSCDKKLKDPCQKGPLGPCKKTPPFVSMWEDEKNYQEKKIFEWGFPKECCPPCQIVRFDELYYKPSNKVRRYQRTWWECCPRYVPKRVCLWCDAKPPEMERRCIEPCGQNKSKSCQNNAPCPRLRMPCCRLARIPPDCHHYPGPSCCKKTKCPFPSYSECCKEDLANLPRRPRECRCLIPSPPEMCTAYRYERWAKQHGIPIWPCQGKKPKYM